MFTFSFEDKIKFTKAVYSPTKAFKRRNRRNGKVRTGTGLH